MGKLCLSAKFPHQEIRWNYGIFRNIIKVTGLDLHIYWKQTSHFHALSKKWQNFSQLTKSCTEEIICQRKFLTANFFTKRIFFCRRTGMHSSVWYFKIVSFCNNFTCGSENLRSLVLKSIYCEFIIWGIQFIQKNNEDGKNLLKRLTV